MARPNKKLDPEKLKALMRFKPTLKDAAAFFECSEDTIERNCRKISGVGFADFRDQNMVHTRFTLIRTAIKKAENGDNTMLIFCLKNLCGWRDKQPEEITQIHVEQNAKPLDQAELIEAIKKARLEK